jgi:uncharacterized RDD family membrane protein YckC
MAKLIVNPTSSNRREISLSRTTLLAIGRDPSNDLVLPDAMVSRRHAVVEWRGSQFFLRDCNSSNGSVVNGDRISEKLLRDGDLVAIGTARLLFRDDLAEPGAKVVPHPSSPKLQCPACGAEYRKGDLFCRECGEKIASPSGPPKVICASCGTAVTLPARFCSACGASIAREEEKRPEPAAEAPIPASAKVETGPDPARLPAIDSDEPVTGPPTPAPVLEGPLDGRSGGSALAASAMPVPSMPVPSGPAPDSAPIAEARPEERARPASARPDEKPRPEERARPDKARSDERPGERGRSGERLRPARTGEVSGIPAKTPAPERPPASFGTRLLAGLADALVLGAAEALLLVPVFYYWSGRAMPRALSDVSFLPILLSILVLPVAGALAAAYYVYSWGVRGATPGQGFFELVVEDEDGRRPIGPARAALRLLGYLLSVASLGVGFLMIAFTGSGLHDRIAGTRVVRGRAA